jgi:hypothetical protein
VDYNSVSRTFARLIHASRNEDEDKSRIKADREIIPARKLDVIVAFIGSYPDLPPFLMPVPARNEVQGLSSPMQEDDIIEKEYAGGFE